MRTAVALSMATNIALPRNPRPTKWRTRSAAIRCSRSGRVMSWYSVAKRRDERSLLRVVELGLLEDRGRAPRRSARW